MNTTTQAEPTQASLLQGVEVWSPVDDTMVRQAAAPSIGELDQAIGQEHSRIIAGRVDEACLSKMPALIDLAASQIAVLLWPVIDRDRVTSVVAIYLNRGTQDTMGAEIWSGKPGRSELCLNQTSYTGLDRFAKLSPYISFPKGSGLPGLAWATNIPQIVDGLASSPTFMRATGAEAEGLDIGFAVPCVSGTSLQAVALLLSGSKTPIARIFETWVPGQQGGSLRLHLQAGAYVELDDVAKEAKKMSVPAGDTWIGRAWATRQPVVVCDTSGRALERNGAVEGSLTSGLAIPIIVLDDVAAVAVLMW